MNPIEFRCEPVLAKTRIPGLFEGENLEFFRGWRVQVGLADSATNLGCLINVLYCLVNVFVTCSCISGFCPPDPTLDPAGRLPPAIFLCAHCPPYFHTLATPQLRAEHFNTESSLYTISAHVMRTKGWERRAREDKVFGRYRRQCMVFTPVYTYRVRNAILGYESSETAAWNRHTFLRSTTGATRYLAQVASGI